MGFFIHGIGTAVPEHRVAQEHAAAMAEMFGGAGEGEQQQLRALYRLTRVRTRHSVLLEPDGRGDVRPHPSFAPRLHEADRGPRTSERMAIYEREAPPLGARAAGAALADAGRSASEITHLVTVSCTGFTAPAFDVGLMRALELSPSVARTHIGFMGCHGALNGLRVAKAYTDSSPGACVLLCAVELCSLHYQYGWNPGWLVANSIFADGAAALVGTAAPPPNRDPWRLEGSGAALLEDSEELMSWRIGDHGFEMALSARVPGVIERKLRPWLDGWLAGHHLDVGGVGSWAIHPGGPRILESCLHAAGLPHDACAVSQEVLGELGNMSSPTILFILDRLRRRAAPRPCVALGFGPGLAVEAALFADPA